MANTFPVEVPHLFGTTASCQMPKPYDPTKPTCVLVNSFAMTAHLFKPQFEDESLLEAMNLLAIEPLGHGQTRTNSPAYTFWDSAIMNLQVLDALGVSGKVFALGTSQGGFIVARMALLAPHRIAGILPLGTSMDYESERSRSLGNFDAHAALKSFIDEIKSVQLTPDFVLSKENSQLAIVAGFGDTLPPEDYQYWQQTLEANYSGNDGRLRIKESAINLRDRDGIRSRLFEIICPVLWMHGTRDEIYTIASAEDEIKCFVNSIDARLMIVDGGQHYLSATQPTPVNEALLAFVQKYN